MKGKYITLAVSKTGYCSRNTANMAAIVWKLDGQMKINQTCFDLAKLSIWFNILKQMKYFYHSLIWWIL